MIKHSYSLYVQPRLAVRLSALPAIWPFTPSTLAPSPIRDSIRASISTAPIVWFSSRTVSFICSALICKPTNHPKPIPLRWTSDTYNVANRHWPNPKNHQRRQSAALSLIIVRMWLWFLNNRKSQMKRLPPRILSPGLLPISMNAIRQWMSRPFTSQPHRNDSKNKLLILAPSCQSRLVQRKRADLLHIDGWFLVLLRRCRRCQRNRMLQLHRGPMSSRRRPRNTRRLAASESDGWPTRSTNFPRTTRRILFHSLNYECDVKPDWSALPHYPAIRDSPRKPHSTLIERRPAMGSDHHADLRSAIASSSCRHRAESEVSECPSSTLDRQPTNPSNLHHAMSFTPNALNPPVVIILTSTNSSAVAHLTHLCCSLLEATPISKYSDKPQRPPSHWPRSNHPTYQLIRRSHRSTTVIRLPPTRRRTRNRFVPRN